MNLADILNPVAEVEITPGLKLKLRNLPIGKIFEILVGELRKLSTTKTGSELNDEAQKCLESGRIPWSAVEELVWAGIEAGGSSGITRADVAALVTLKNMDKALELVAIACGFKREAGEGTKKNDPASLTK